MQTSQRIDDKDCALLAEKLAADLRTLSGLSNTKETTMIGLIQKTIYTMLSGTEAEESRLRLFLISSLSKLIGDLSGVAVTQPVHCLSKSKLKKLSAVADQIEIIVYQLIEAFFTWEDN